MQIILRYLLFLRGVTILGQLLALWVIDRAFEFPVPWLAVLTTLSAVALYTLVSWRRAHHAQLATREFVLQLLVDIAALSVLVYFTGGALNPFISLFLLPIIFAAAALPSKPVAIVAAAAIAAYTALMFIHHPMHHSLDNAKGHQLHLWGMWYGFLLSAGCVAAFVARLARGMREQNVLLAAARESALRNERVVALGMLAAGTAHELGTPLATMSILAEELSRDLRQQPSLLDSVKLLQGELQRCKVTLARLAADAGEHPAEAGFRQGIAKFMSALLENFRYLNPDITVHTLLPETTADFSIVPDRTLQQALLNLLNNAADAADSLVTIAYQWDARTLRLTIEDDGPGIDHAVRPQLGRELVSTKGDAGMGLGIYLAVGVIQRYGGEIEFHPRRGGGTEVTVRLPLGPLSADSR